MFGDRIKSVAKGDPIRAAHYNKLVARANMQVIDQNSFVGRGIKMARAPGAEAAAAAVAFTCVITSDLTGATWDDANDRLTPSSNTGAAVLLDWDSGNSRYDEGNTITPEWVDTADVDVATNKGRIGKGVYADGRYQLFSVSCEEIDYTT